MKNKKIIIIISLIIFILICCISSYFIYKNKHTNDDEINKTYSLTNIGNHVVEEDEIEVTDIQIHKSISVVEVVTTIKNNSPVDIEGFFISIELLNSKGDVITTIAKKLNKPVLSNNSFEFTSYITGIENMEDIETAQIQTIEKY